MKKLLEYGRRKAAFIGLAALLLSFGLVLGSCENGLQSNSESTKADFSDDLIDAINDALNGVKRISVKFEVTNGGAGLLCSDGIVSTQDDTYLKYDGDIFANDFTITITVPVDDEYLNIRWVGQEANYLTYIQGKLPVTGAGKYTIYIDYCGVGNIGSIRDLSSYGIWYGDVNWDGWGDFQSAKARAIPDE